jgi:hypothetical protein
MTPSKFIYLQRYVIIGSFIIAAAVSPGRRPVDQTLIAAPIIGFYYMAAFVIWLADRRRHPAALVPAVAPSGASSFTSESGSPEARPWLADVLPRRANRIIDLRSI